MRVLPDDTKQPPILKKHEIARLFEVAGQSKNPYSIRLLTLIKLQYGSGLDCDELVSLPACAISDDYHFVKVTGEQYRSRTVPISAGASKAISDYFPVWPCFAPKEWCGYDPSHFLFPDPMMLWHLMPAQYAKMLFKLSGEAGINSVKVGPNALRHAFAVHMHASGCPQNLLQYTLGSDTQIKLERSAGSSSLEHKKSVLRRHPLARLSNSYGSNAPYLPLKRDGDDAA